MALIKGEDLQQGQVQQGGEIDLSQYGDPEERRMVERGMIILKLRRYWRIVCFGLAVFASIVNIISVISSGNGSIGGIFGAIALSFVGFGIIYVIILYLFLYILIDKVLMTYFFIRDLVTKKDTRF